MITIILRTLLVQATTYKINLEIVVTKDKFISNMNMSDKENKLKTSICASIAKTQNLISFLDVAIEL